MIMVASQEEEEEEQQQHRRKKKKNSLSLSLSLSLFPSTLLWGVYLKTLIDHYNIPIAHSFKHFLLLFLKAKYTYIMNQTKKINKKKWTAHSKYRTHTHTHTKEEELLPQP